MKLLSTQQETNRATMSSREIATLCNKRHDNVLKLIRELLEGGLLKFTTPQEYVHPQNRQVYTEYLSDKRDSFVIVARLSPEFTAVVVDRWQELEEKVKQSFNLPSNYKEALIALVAEVEKNEKLEVELEVARPKVEYYDAVLDSSELLTTTIIAKNHGLTAQKLHEFLHQQRVIYKQGDKWYVYQEHLDKGLMRTRTYLGEDGNTITYFKWTKKGEAFINDLINEKGFLSVIFGRHIAL